MLYVQTIVRADELDEHNSVLIRGVSLQEQLVGQQLVLQARDRVVRVVDGSHNNRFVVLLEAHRGLVFTWTSFIGSETVLVHLRSNQLHLLFELSLISLELL